MVASSTDPVLLITRRVAGASLFAVVDGIDRDVAGRQLAEFLAAMHASAARFEAVVGSLPGAAVGPQHPASTAQLRARLGQWLSSDDQRLLTHWYDWADATLSPPGSPVLVHADLHGDNQVWTGDRLEVVVDYENVSAAEPEYDLRTFPGTGPGLELLTATSHHYERLTGVRLAVDRVLAWHLRNALNDVLWRSEAGVPLPDHRTPAQWIDDLAGRFELAGIDPSRR
jgi:aminoglycoside phosphotransferase (APT) family kinase protein